MDTRRAMAAALELVQRVTGAPGFAALSADPELRKAASDDSAGALRAQGIDVPAGIQRVEVKRRHTTPKAWAQGARGGGVEWRFLVQTGATPFRVILLCDPWPADTPAETA